MKGIDEVHKICLLPKASKDRNPALVKKYLEAFSQLSFIQRCI